MLIASPAATATSWPRHAGWPDRFVPVGDCQRAFQTAAAADGIDLSKQSFRWLCEQGHFGLARVAEHDDDADAQRLSEAIGALSAIYAELGGEPDVLRDGRVNPLRGDFVHEPTGTLIEIDESQHFTSFRLKSLQLYPSEFPLGFDLDVYVRLCEDWQAKSDRYRQAKAARGFGVGGRQRQRAYYDALRDLAAPAMGRPPLIRVDAAHGDGEQAYRRHRDRLLQLLTA